MKKKFNLFVLLLGLFLFPIMVQGISIAADGKAHIITGTTINVWDDGVNAKPTPKCQFSDSGNNYNATLEAVASGKNYVCQITTSTPGDYMVQYGTILEDGSFNQQGSTVSIKVYDSSKATNVKKETTTEKKTVETEFDICDTSKNPTIMAGFKLGGIVILIIKIVDPIFLIVWGMIDMAKAVVSDKQDAVKSNAVIFAKRAIAAVLIFLVPTIILSAFDLVEDWTSIKSKYDPCINCLLDISTCENASFITK